MCQAFTSTAIIDQFLKGFVLKMGYKPFTDQSDGTLNDIYDRIFYYYQHLIHDKRSPDSNFIGSRYSCTIICILTTMETLKLIISKPEFEPDFYKIVLQNASNDCII